MRCPAGTYSALAGAGSVSACHPCPVSTFASRTGHSACQHCTTGTFTTAAGSTLSDQCISSGSGSDKSVAIGAGVGGGVGVVLLLVVMVVVVLRSRRSRRSLDAGALNAVPSGWNSALYQVAPDIEARQQNQSNEYVPVAWDDANYTVESQVQPQPETGSYEMLGASTSVAESSSVYVAVPQRNALDMRDRKNSSFTNPTDNDGTLRPRGNTAQFEDRPTLRTFQLKDRLTLRAFSTHSNFYDTAVECQQAGIQADESV